VGCLAGVDRRRHELPLRGHGLLDPEGPGPVPGGLDRHHAFFLDGRPVDFLGGDDAAAVGGVGFQQLSGAGGGGVNHIVGQQHGEGLVTDQVARAADGVT